MLYACKQDGTEMQLVSSFFTSSYISDDLPKFSASNFFSFKISYSGRRSY